MKLPTYCPKCKGKHCIDWDARRCRRCYVALLKDGDDGHANRDENWYKFIERGPRGPGWYQRALVETWEVLGPGGIPSSQLQPDYY